MAALNSLRAPAHKTQGIENDGENAGLVDEHAQGHAHGVVNHAKE